MLSEAAAALVAFFFDYTALTFWKGPSSKVCSSQMDEHALYLIKLTHHPIARVRSECALQKLLELSLILFGILNSIKHYLRLF